MTKILLIEKCEDCIFCTSRGCNHDPYNPKSIDIYNIPEWCPLSSLADMCKLIKGGECIPNCKLKHKKE